MAELIEQELGTLKTQVIENSFLLFEAHLIKAIPLCSSAQPDSLYFSCEKKWSLLGEIGLQVYL